MLALFEILGAILELLGALGSGGSRSTRTTEPPAESAPQWMSARDDAG